METFRKYDLWAVPRANTLRERAVVLDASERPVSLLSCGFRLWRSRCSPRFRRDWADTVCSCWSRFGTHSDACSMIVSKIESISYLKFLYFIVCLFVGCFFLLYLFSIYFLIILI